MITAREAASISRNKKTLVELDKLIRQAAANGGIQIRFADRDNSIGDITTELNRLGYSVSINKYSFTFSHKEYYISW